MFLRVLLKEEEEEELEGTDPEAFGEFRRCAQESPPPPDEEEDKDDAMMIVFFVLVVASSFRARNYRARSDFQFFSIHSLREERKKKIFRVLNPITVRAWFFGNTFSRERDAKKRT